MSEQGGVEIVGNYGKWFHVKKHMVPSKIGYFIYFSAWGCYLPFINIYLVSVGLTYKEAGFISGICYAFQAIACPIWGFVADLTGQRRLICTILCLGSGVTVFAQPWVSWKLNSDFLQTCLQNETRTNDTVRMNVIDDTRNNRTGNYGYMGRSECGREPFSNTLFYVMMIMFILEQGLTGPLVSLLDSIIMNVVTSSDDPSSFGIQRVFGSIGFGIFSFLSGFTADYFHHPTLPKYSTVFFFSAPLFIIMIPIVWVLLNQTNWNVDTTKQYEEADPMLEMKSEERQLNLVMTALKNPRNIFFFTSILVAGIAISVYLSFTFLLLFEKMNASKTAMGLTSLTASISEIIMFPFSGKIIEYFGSPLPCLELGIFSSVIRLLLLSFIENAWASIPVQFLHSFGFALSWAAAMEYVQSASSKAIYMTMFSILVSIKFGFAFVIGNIIGGIIYDKYSGQLLFRGSATFAGVWLVIMILVLHVFRWIPMKIDNDETNLETKKIKIQNRESTA